MTVRNVLAALLAVGVAAVCFRLGLWQLDRLAARRALNAQVEARMHHAPLELAALPADTTMRYRRVTVSGSFDYDHELVLTGRSRQGSPGVHVVTPLRRGPGQPAVLVNRGWLYSPDAATVPLERWREGRDALLVGYVEQFSAGDGPVRSQSNVRAWRRLDPDTLRAALPYAVEPFLVVALSDAPPSDTTPVRLPLPELSEGSHQSYAFQWFAFGAIALVGVTALIRHDLKHRGARRAPNA